MTNETNATPKKGRPPKGWRNTFLKALRSSGNIGHSCRKARVNRTTAYRLKARDPLFAAKWETAIEDSVDVMEFEARRRAVKGTDKPVFQKGEQVGVIREYSDTLLMFLLKANKPDKFRDNFDAMKLVGELLAKTNQFSIPIIDDRPEPDATG